MAATAMATTTTVAATTTMAAATVIAASAVAVSPANNDRPAAVVAGPPVSAISVAHADSNTVPEAGATPIVGAIAAVIAAIVYRRLALNCRALFQRLTLVRLPRPAMNVGP